MVNVLATSVVDCSVLATSVVDCSVLATSVVDYGLKPWIGIGLSPC